MLASSGLPAIYEQATTGSYLSRIIYNQASTLAYRDAFLAVGVLFFLTVIPAWFMTIQRQADEA
jgi:hypothetical protein